MSTPPTEEKQSPHMTPLYIGPEVHFAGTVTYEGTDERRALISGVLEGNLSWNGLVHVAQGATVRIKETLRCRELDVAGRIQGMDQAKIDVGALRLRPTAEVEASVISVPPGAIEQQRGSLLNATVSMESNHRLATNAAAPTQRGLALVASATTAASQHAHKPLTSTVHLQAAEHSERTGAVEGGQRADTSSLVSLDVATG